MLLGRQINRRRHVKSLFGEPLEDRRMLAVTFEHNDIAYFLSSDTATVERYSIQSEAWLSTIELADSSSLVPSAGHADDDGLYVSFGSALYRFNLSGQDRTHLLNATSEIDNLHTDDNLLFANYGGQFISIDKNTDTVVDTLSYFYSLRGTSISPESNRLFARSTGVSPSDIHYVGYDDSGMFTGANQSVYHGDYPGASATWVFPDNSKVVDSAGIIYSTGSLTYVSSFNGTVTDIDFLADEIPIVLQGNTLTAFNTFHLPTGSLELDHSPSEIYVNDSSVITFTPDSSDVGYSANVFAIDDLDPPTPGVAVDPTGVAYEPDTVIVAGDGTLLLFEASLQSVFRWDPVTQRYLDTVPLVGVPEYMAYAAPTNMVYLAYDSGLIRKIDLSSDDLTEEPFAALPSTPLGLSTAGPYVFAVDPSGAWVSHYTFAPDGTQIEAVEWNYTSREFVWSEANQKMYFFRDGTSPNDLLWEEINADDMTYPNEPPGGIGAKRDSPLHSSSGFTHPIRVSPDGSIAVLGSGVIHDAITLERQTTALANSISDAAWLDGELYSIRDAGLGLSQFQQWEGSTFASTNVVQHDGEPVALRAIEQHDRLVGITLNDDGVPEFQVLDANLGTIPEPVPVSLAGDDGLVLVGTAIALDGSASFDPDASSASLTYAWSVLSGPSGGTFSDANSSTTDFTPPEIGEYVLQLEVSDGQYSGFDTLTLTSRTNQAPVADASLSETTAIDGVSSITLDGTLSTDSDGDSLSYEWQITSSPAGTNPTIINETESIASLLTSAPGMYEVELTVTDPFTSATDTVAITVRSNAAPVANATLSDTMTIVGGETIELNGTMSSDTDDDALEYEWIVSDRPPGSSALINASQQAMATFDPDLPGLYAVDLRVSDGLLDDTTTIVIMVRSNEAPVADTSLSPTSVVANGHPVQLNGTLSSDADGDSLTYSWAVLESPAGSNPIIANPDQAITDFETDTEGDYVLELSVSDGILSGQQTFHISSSINQLPTADAALSDFVISLDSLATLDGTQSSDPDGDPLTYFWEATGVPTGANPLITSPTEGITTLSVDLPGFYAIRLTVNDGLATHSDTIVISAGTNNLPPRADASLSDSHAQVGVAAVLDGSRSTDGDGDALTYSWRIVDKPVGSAAIVADPSERVTSVTPDVEGTYVAELTVNDGTSSHTTTTQILVGVNQAPIAVIDVANDRIRIDEMLTLDGQMSSDANGDTLDYAWSVISSSNGHVPTIVDADQSVAQFTSDTAGTYAIELAVSDGADEHRQVILVTVAENSAPTAVATVSSNTTRPSIAVTLDGSASSDTDGDALVYLWTVAESPAGSDAVIGDSRLATTSFAASVPGEYVLQLTVSDQFESAASTVQIVVKPENPWYSAAAPYDSNGNGAIDPLDALLIINDLTDREYSDAATGALPDINTTALYLDANNDGFLSPIDAILVINHIGTESATVQNAAPFADTPATEPVSGSRMQLGEDSEEDEASVIDWIWQTGLFAD
jgi:hypothetical protein